MKRFLILAVLALFTACQQERVLQQGEIWPDDNGIHINAHGGGILDYDGRYYWFGEHKIEGDKGNRAHVGVHCYSSADLCHWKDEGVALAVMPDGSGSDIEKGCILERPKVIYNAKTGKFVMWFHLELKGKGYSVARAGVAVADKPAGPYTFIRSVRPNAGQWPLVIKDGKPVAMTEKEREALYKPQHLKRDFKGGQMSRDMTLFVDDDAKGYHIYTSEENATLHIALLADDYLSHTGIYTRCLVDRFMEAPAVCKRDGKYYLIASGCTGWAPNEARSAVAASIFGPWKELGNPCRGENAKLTFGGQSTYIIPPRKKSEPYIFMADIWRPKNAIDGRYVWLPIDFSEDKPVIHWQPVWDMNAR